MKDILSTITAYRQARGWTEYQLSERSGLPQSTISSWYRKNMVPTVPSLEKICEAFGITLSQLFAGDNTPIVLTAKQKEMLERWDRLNDEQQAVIFQLIDKVLQVYHSRSPVFFHEVDVCWWGLSDLKTITASLIIFFFHYGLLSWSNDFLSDDRAFSSFPHNYCIVRHK